jgi:hypothetical protein
VLTAGQEKLLDEMTPLSPGETVGAAAGGFLAACLLEFGPPEPDQAEVEAALRKRVAASA